MLEVTDLTVSYGDLTVIKRASLTLQEGEIACIIGSNGAGKSALIKAISGYIQAKSGSITFFGKEITRIPCHVLVEQGIVRVPEGRRLFPNMTVTENLELGAYNRRASAGKQEMIKRVFSYFPILRERAHQFAGTLSGGEQQMVAIGRGLMARPRLLMLDEVSLGLSPLVVQNIYEIIREINLSGITVLVVEQNIEMALSSSNRGYVLSNGRIVLEGEGSELLANPQIREAYLGM